MSRTTPVTGTAINADADESTLLKKELFMTQLSLVKNRLFAAEGLAVRNLKLYPGTNRDSTVEEFSEQINKALSQIEAGEFEEVIYED